ncbi:MAG: exo-alpha-sialidase, partial [Candidatus Hydrogenedentes bacterium]|nr:exo-alpha-sialidase [Candidatus Hydrogenedentota bacterium]
MAFNGFRIGLAFALTAIGVAVASLAQEAAAPADLQALLQEEMQRSQPDYVVYVPKSVDGSTFDTGNEHFLVFDGPDGSLMAVWTQSTHEGAGDHRIMFVRSGDGGKTWSEPKRIAGSPRKGEGNQASWAFPMVSKS